MSSPLYPNSKSSQKFKVVKGTLFDFKKLRNFRERLRTSRNLIDLQETSGTCVEVQGTYMKLSELFRNLVNFEVLQWTT